MRLSILAMASSLAVLPLLGALAQSSPTALADQPEGTVAVFDRTMRDWARQHGVKQASIAVMHEDRLVLAQGYGGRGADERVDVWSLSKAITAVCVATLITDGKLRLDDKVGRLHLKQRPADPRVNDIRIEDLLTHRSGWPKRFDGNGFAPGLVQLLRTRSSGSVTADMLMPGIFAQPLSWLPGEHYEYSNLNYLLLGQVIEAVTGEPYAQGCANRVLTRAGISRPQLDPVWGGLAQAAGGWSLSGPEYLAFLRLFEARQPDLLTPDLRRWLWTGDRKWTNAGQEVAYSLGVLTRPARRVLWHGGAWDWSQADAWGGPIQFKKQGTYAVLHGDGVGWFASFDTVNGDKDPKATAALDVALWKARTEVRSWPKTDGFIERGVRPIALQSGGGQRK
jgi:CubicO group peptidase (beta-lactamase class C family)